MNNQILPINRFAGVNYSTTASQIANNEASDMLNFMLDEQGALEKRTGYVRCFDTLGAGKVNGLFVYRKPDGTEERLLAHGTKLYRWNNGDAPVLLSSALADHKASFFTMNGNLYMLDGTHFLEYNGTVIRTPEPYVPTLFIAMSPTGGGEPYESWNLLGNKFRNRFSTDGAATKFYLSHDNLDGTTVKASLDEGVTFSLTEGTDLTVNRTTGEVTFTYAPAVGTDYLVIEAGKTVAGFPDRVKKCTLAALYGGANDFRVLLSGNADEKSAVLRSGAGDATYWPEESIQAVGNTNEAVTAFTLQYDTLVIEKEYSKWLMTYELNDQGIGYYPVRPLNDTIGCIATDSSQLVENSPVSLSNRGVYILSQSNVRTEKNVELISKEVNPKLLQEANLKDAVAVDYQNKYILVVNNRAYVWYYKQTFGDKDGTHYVWTILDNIKAACFIEIDGELYFGSNEEGIVFRFKSSEENAAYSDDDAPIKAFWQSKLLDLGTPDVRKIVDSVYYTMKPYTHTSCEFYINTDTAVNQYVGSDRIDLLDFRNIDFAHWSFLVNSLPQTSKTKVKAKKVVFFQLTVKNEVLNEGLGITSIDTKYNLQGYVK